MDRVAMSPHVTALMRRWRCELPCAIGEWVRKCREPDADIDGIRLRIASQLQEWLGHGFGDDDPAIAWLDDDEARDIIRKGDEDLIQEYLDLCQDIAAFPEETVATVFSDWQRLWGDASTAEDRLALLEEPARQAVRAALGDRARYAFALVGYLKDREGFLEYWNDIYDELVGTDLLKEKAADFEDDPQIGVLVKAYKLGALMDARENCLA